MTIYKKVLRKEGSINYFKDGKYIKLDKIKTLPQEVLNMEPGELKIEAPKPEPIKPKGRFSIMSGEPATHQRYVNGKVYDLTQAEYNTCTLGQILQSATKIESIIA